MNVHREMSSHYGIKIPVVLTDAAENRLAEIDRNDSSENVTVIGENLTLATVLSAARKAHQANPVTVQVFEAPFYAETDRMFYTISRHDDEKVMLIGLASEHKL